MSAKAAAQRPTCFLDLCAAGAPLAAIMRCLPTCKDQLQLGQAVGKRYRDLVLAQITHLDDLNLELSGCSMMMPGRSHVFCCGWRECRLCYPGTGLIKGHALTQRDLHSCACCPT